MTPLDHYLRRVRIARVRPHLRRGDVVLDVGSDDGSLFRALADTLGSGSIGIEPTLAAPVSAPGYTLLPGLFPDAVPAGTRCDVITMLAVVEHMPPEVQARLADACAALLPAGGRIVITIPSPRVDTILHILAALRLIHGIGLHEHYGFDTAGVPALFPGPRFRLALHRRFQLGLNNLYVFERTADG
ncbi:MAG: methyltransferase domain-containing protein [Chloroflexota bacterium]